MVVNEYCWQILCGNTSRIIDRPWQSFSKVFADGSKSFLPTLVFVSIENILHRIFSFPSFPVCSTLSHSLCYSRQYCLFNVSKALQYTVDLKSPSTFQIDNVVDRQALGRQHLAQNTSML